MALRILGQLELAGTGDELLFMATGPTAVSTVVVCNVTEGLGASELYYSLIAVPASMSENQFQWSMEDPVWGGTTLQSHLVHRAAIPAAGTDYHTIGITLEAGAELWAWSEAAGLSMTVFGDG